MQSDLQWYVYVKECTMCVVVYSNIQKPAACEVFRITHSDWTVDGVNLVPIGHILEPSRKYLLLLYSIIPTRWDVTYLKTAEAMKIFSGEFKGRVSVSFI